MNWRWRARRQLTTRPHLPIAAWIGLTGLAGALNGGLLPSTMQTSFPLWFVQMWTLAIAVGGILSTWGCLAENTRTESAGLVLVVYGVGLYGVVFLIVAWPASFALAMVCGALISMCVIRMRVLSLSRAAKERAAAGVDDELE